MPPYPNTFAPSKKTRDVGHSDTILAMANTRPMVVVAGGPTLGPDTLLLLDAIGPEQVSAAPTGTPVIGTDDVVGTSATYSNQTASVNGLVIVSKRLPKQTYRIKANTTFQYQSDIDAIIGNQYVLVTTTDADGFDHQELDVAGGANTTYGLRVVDGDFVTATLEIEIVTPIV